MAPVICAAALIVVLAVACGHAWWRLDRLGRENQRLRTHAETAQRRGYEQGWADVEWTYGSHAHAAQDELALARHHRLAARQGLRCTWGRGVTNRPEWS